MIGAATLPRDRFVDGLRGLALGGVLIVNSLSFPHVFSSPVGVVEPAGSTLALLVQALCAGLLQAKSYPLLMFLVGYAWAMRSRRSGRSLPVELVARRRAQMLRQGGLGIVHGLFVYFGDILSWLALLGLLLLGAPRQRLRTLCRRIWLWTALWTIFGGSTWLWVVFATEPLPGQAHWLTGAVSWPDLFAVQRLAYASYLFQVPWQLPMMLALGTLGVLAGRLRVLERARVGARVWTLGVRVLLPIGIVLNAGLAGWMVWLNLYGNGDLTPADLGSQFAGPWLAAGVVCLLARAWHVDGARWLAACAPLGRMTMSIYVAHTLSCLALFAGPAAALAPTFGSIGLFLYGVVFWVAALLVAAKWQTLVGAGPLERWVRGPPVRPRIRP